MRKSVGMNTDIVAIFQEWNDKKSEFEELGELLEEETDAELCEEAHKDREVRSTGFFSSDPSATAPYSLSLRFHKPKPPH